MKIIEKLYAKAQDSKNPCPTIAFLGDSVTEGCFELVPRNEDGFDNVYDRDSAYHSLLKKALENLFPSATMNIINAGVAGTDAKYGLERLDRDVLSKKPDLTVVCFGLNDCGKEDEGISDYIASLTQIFKALRDIGSEIIFMTPNMMASSVSKTIHPSFIELAKKLAKRQNDGVLDRYINAAKALCAELEIPVCDVYSKWKRMAELGVDTTELLSNKLNHPTRELHKLFASSLLDIIMR